MSGSLTPEDLVLWGYKFTPSGFLWSWDSCGHCVHSHQGQQQRQNEPGEPVLADSSESSISQPLLISCFV